MHIKRCVLIAALAAVFTGSAFPQTAGDYGRIEALRRANRKVSGLRSSADGEHYTFILGNDVLRCRYDDRSSRRVIHSMPFAVADYEISPDGEWLLAASAENIRRIYRHSYATDYWLGPVGGEMKKVLEDVRDASFSPDGERIAYSRDNNLCIYDRATGVSTAVTSDGCRGSIINGTSDWVYEEEYGFTRGYAFSPDGRQLAYLKFDESRVPLASIVRYDFESSRDSTLTFKYPRAGEANSAVSLYVYNLQEGVSRRVDTGEESDQYIFNPSWTPAGELCFYRVNRRQNIFETVLAASDGSVRVIYREESEHYVERPDARTVMFVDGDRFLVREETTTGWMHLYLHSISKGRLNAVTSGRWEVTSVAGVADGYVWYISTERSPLRRDLYRVKLDGRGKRRLTEGDGWVTVAPSAGMKYYVESFSNASTPDVVTVRRGDGGKVEVLADNREAVAALGGGVCREFFDIVTERGDTLNAYRVLPRGFDPSQRYPVLLTQYSGPGSQQVADRWTADWEDVLADCGYIVVCADGRGTGFRGERFKKLTAGRLGELEVEDQLSVARYVASLDYADPDRIGIYGWSYGGFMALGCALKGEGLFKMAIAVAPVTSWRWYDTIYTEIYNGLPQENPAGYDDNSPVNFADLLAERTKLLIMHGSSDDNVHLKNTMEMVRALNAAGKSFDLLIYPDQNHSMLPSAGGQIRRKMTAYTLENL